MQANASKKILISVFLEEEEIQSLLEGKHLEKTRVYPMYGEDIGKDMLVNISKIPRQKKDTKE